MRKGDRVSDHLRSREESHPSKSHGGDTFDGRLTLGERKLQTQHKGSHYTDVSTNNLLK